MYILTECMPLNYSLITLMKHKGHKVTRRGLDSCSCPSPPKHTGNCDVCPGIIWYPSSALICNDSMLWIFSYYLSSPQWNRPQEVLRTPTPLVLLCARLALRRCRCWRPETSKCTQPSPAHCTLGSTFRAGPPKIKEVWHLPTALTLLVGVPDFCISVVNLLHLTHTGLNDSAT